MVKALRKKGIPVEFHLVSEGGHGFGLAVNNPHVGSWTENLRLWLGWLNGKRLMLPSDIYTFPMRELRE